MRIKKILTYIVAVANHYPDMRRDFIVSSLLMIIIAGVNVLFPYFLSRSVNIISSPQPHYQNFYLFVLLFGISWTAANMLEWLKNIASATFLVKTEAAMHSLLYIKIIYAKLSIISDTSPGQIIEEISRGRSSLISLIHTLFWGLFPLIIQVFFSLFFIIQAVGPVLSLFFMIALSLFFIVSYYFSRLSESIHHNIMDAHNALTGHLAEKLTLLDDIKINNAFYKEKNSIGSVTDAFIRAVSSGNKKIGIYMIYQCFFL